MINTQQGYITPKAALVLNFSGCRLKSAAVLHFIGPGVQKSLLESKLFSAESLANSAFQRF